jgi:UDP-glucose 4-epimerase
MTTVQDRVESAFRGSSALVTGGLGFIGSHLAERLVALGADVTVIDNLAPHHGGLRFNVEEFATRIRIEVADVRDSRLMAQLVRSRDYVFSLAGQSSHMDSMEMPSNDVAINCLAPLATLEACRRHNATAKIIFASTRQVYGRPNYLPVDEEHPLTPVDVNGVNKIAAEWYHRLYHDVYDMRTCILRLTNTFGPRMRVKDARQTFLGLWIKCVVAGQSFEVWDETSLRDLTYVDDAIDAFLLAAATEHTSGGLFNVGGDGPVSLGDLAKLLVSVDGAAEFVIRPFPPERKRIDIGHYYADYTRLQSTVGWQPTVPVAEGLSRTLAFYRKHLHRYI